MKRESWLSELVQTYIEVEDHFADRDLPPEERADAQKNWVIVDKIVKYVVRSRESLTDKSPLREIEWLIEAEPELMEHFLALRRNLKNSWI